MSTLTARERFTQARISLLRKFPFFGRLSTHLKIKEDPTSPTLATDGEYVFYNPHFVGYLTDADLMFILSHEVLHCAFKHVGWPGVTRRGNRDEDLWSQACDYVINGVLVESGLPMPKGVPGMTVDLMGGKAQLKVEELVKGLYNPAFKGLCVEEVYEKLKQQTKQQQQSNNKQRFDDHSRLSRKQANGDETKGQGSLEGGDDPVKQMIWKERISNADQAAKLAGKGLSCFGEMIKDILNPRISFADFLHSNLQAACPQNYRWTPPNRRHLWNDIILPSAYGEKLYCGVLLDSSGSMSTKELQYGLGTLQNILDTFHEYEVHVAAFSGGDKPHSHKTFETGDRVTDYEFQDRGGTLVGPGIKWFEENHPKIGCLVVFTDGGLFDVPEEPPFPVLWVVTQRGFKPAFGQHIQLDCA